MEITWKTWLSLFFVSITAWYFVGGVPSRSADAIHPLQAGYGKLTYQSSPTLVEEYDRREDIETGDFPKTVVGIDEKPLTSVVSHSRKKATQGFGEPQSQDKHSVSTASVGAFRDPDDPASLPALLEKIEIGFLKDPEDPDSVNIRSRNIQVGEFKKPEEQ